MTITRKLKVWCPKTRYYKDRAMCNGCIYHASRADSLTTVGCSF